MAVQKKQIIANIYQAGSGALLATWSEFGFSGFSKELTGGLSECVLTLAKVFDYSSVDLVLGNEVELGLPNKSVSSAYIMLARALKAHLQKKV